MADAVPPFGLPAGCVGWADWAANNAKAAMAMTETAAERVNCLLTNDLLAGRDIVRTCDIATQHLS